MSRFLHSLIHSLKTSEKVYFKRSAKTHAARESKNYLELYNNYEGLASYDLDKIKARITSETLKKYHSSEVNYLTEKIMLSLFNLKLKRNSNQIQRGLIISEMLASKGFRKEALKKIKSVKKKAIYLEEFTRILRLIELEEIVLFDEGIIGYKETLKQLHEEREVITKTIQNLNQYHIIRQEIREIQFSHDLQSEYYKALKNFKDEPLLISKEHCLSNKAKEHLFYSQVLFHYLQRDFGLSLSFAKRHVNFIKEYYYLFGSSKIIPSISNYLFQAALCSDKNEFNNAEKLLFEYSKKEMSNDSYIKYILHTRNLEMAYYSDDLKLLNKHLNCAINLYNSFKDKFQEAQIQYLFMVIVRAFIQEKEFDNAMRYSNLWLRRGVLTYRKIQAHLFSVIIHYELKLHDLLASEVVILSKLQSKYLRDKPTIQAILKYLRSYLKKPANNKSTLKTLQSDLESIKKINKGYYKFISFDYHKWSLGLE